MESIKRPEHGKIYFAPINAQYSSEYPIVYGQTRGSVVDMRTQQQAVVYSTRELAEEALADPAQWHPEVVKELTIRAVTPRGQYQYDWADEQKEQPHSVVSVREIEAVQAVSFPASATAAIGQATAARTQARASAGSLAPAQAPSIER